MSLLEILCALESLNLLLPEPESDPHSTAYQGSQLGHSMHFVCRMSSRAELQEVKEDRSLCEMPRLSVQRKHLTQCFHPMTWFSPLKSKALSFLLLWEMAITLWESSASRRDQSSLALQLPGMCVSGLDHGSVRGSWDWGSRCAVHLEEPSLNRLPRQINPWMMLLSLVSAVFSLQI